MDAGAIFVIVVVIIVLGLLMLAGLKNLIYICAPNEVLIFSGTRPLSRRQILWVHPRQRRTQAKKTFYRTR